ncbi:MAG TPA: hypothetical protein VD699_04275 [Nitrosopumilaceae archaeon]|nr:hypothetical protein [Nitrosopumilaceae archaeon]
MQTKARGQDIVFPRMIKSPWDEKLPGIVDKGQHGLLDPHWVPSKALACYYNTLCMMIFFLFQ